MAKQDDSLFLLEVLIDKILFVKSPCFSDKDFRTCVNIECPAVEPLEICDDDPGDCVARSGGPFVKTFNNGKSCLFSLKEEDIAKSMSKFPIKITVYKSLPCGCLPTKIVLGEATIDMTKEFVQARKKFLEDPNNVSYQALKDSFRIIGSDGTETGEVVMFLRISCFGKLIVTRFQGAGSAPGLGASSGSAIVDRSCNPKRDFQTREDPCVCGAARGQGKSEAIIGANQPCTHSRGGVCSPARDPYNSMPCEDLDDPCYCTGPKASAKQQMACRNTDQYCLHIPKDCCPTGNKVIFQMPMDSCGAGHKQRAHFNFTSDGVGDVSRDEPGQLMPTTADNYPGVVYDFPKQVIKLRIDKTVEMPGALPSFPCKEETAEEQKFEIIYRSRFFENSSFEEKRKQMIHQENTSQTAMGSSKLQKYTHNVMAPNNEYDKIFLRNNTLSYFSYYINIDKNELSLCNTIDERFINTMDSRCSMKNRKVYGNIFGPKETLVYISLFDNFCHLRNSGTQATASINKCLQVCNNTIPYVTSTFGSDSNYCSTCTMSTNPFQGSKKVISRNANYSSVYFFGRKKDEPKDTTGMGSSSSKIKLHKYGQVTAAPVRSEKINIKGTASVQAQSQSSSTGAQTNNKVRGASAGTSTGKSVSIREDRTKKPCPAMIGTKGDMFATVSHIRIGSREPCPVHGKEPCQGPKCIAASSGEEQAPVKVTTVPNPRRGVFELVIRKIVGAPLARNELLLEWTPPPCRPPPCGAPCTVLCSPPGPYRPSKCKMIVCRPSLCKPKVCKRGCKRPCGMVPCRVPVKKYCRSPCLKPSCCSKPCRYCNICPSPAICTPCGPPCCKPPPCGYPCKSSPCLRPCPVGRKIIRRARSQPRIKSHRKRISPCKNRSKTCPTVRCRSMPGPCFSCCDAIPCPPRKCCSVSPCKSIKHSINNCSFFC